MARYNFGQNFFMILSKSFGYALRGILYIAKMQDEQRKVQIDEIATTTFGTKAFFRKDHAADRKGRPLKINKRPLWRIFSYN